MATSKLKSLISSVSLFVVYLSITFFLLGSFSYLFSKDLFDFFQYGWLLVIPLMAVLSHDLQLEQLESVFRIVPEHLCERLFLPAIFLLSGLHAFGAYCKHLSFQSHMDLAIYGNACKNFLFSTMKGDVWLLADHFEPTLLLFSPLCKIWNPSTVLLITQALVWGIGAIGVHRLARLEGFSIKLATLFSFLYLQFYGTTVPVFYDFHLITLALGILPWLFYFLRSEQWFFFWMLVPLYLGLKENTSLTLALLGASLIFEPKKNVKIHGLLLFALSLVAFWIIMQFLFPHFRNGQPSMYFEKYYSHLGRNLREVVLSPFFDPIHFFSSFLTLRKTEYLFHLFLPFLFLPLLNWKRSIVLIPGLFINLASNDRNITVRTSHYEAELYPLLFLLTVLFLSRQWKPERTRRLGAVWLLFVFSLWGGRSLGWHVVRWWPNKDHLYLHNQLATYRPEKKKKVCAPQKLAAHLTQIPSLYMMDYIGSENDWRKADQIIIAYPSKNMGHYSSEAIEATFVEKFNRDFKLLYQDRRDTSFRIWEKLN